MQLWAMVPAIAPTERLYALLDAAGVDLVDHGDPGSGVRLGLSLYEPHLHPLEHRRAVLAAEPVPHLNMPQGWPALDFVLSNPDLVSRRLRDALMLTPDEVVYGAIDCAFPPEAARRADYRRLELLQWGAPIDPARTAGHVVNLVGEGGAWTTEWRPRFGLPPNAPPNPIHWRDDFVPPAPAFRVPGLQLVLVTEALADRVARAGFPDVTFMDIAGPQTPGVVRLRP